MEYYIHKITKDASILCTSLSEKLIGYSECLGALAGKIYQSVLRY